MGDTFRDIKYQTQKMYRPLPVWLLHKDEGVINSHGVFVSGYNVVIEYKKAHDYVLIQTIYHRGKYYGCYHIMAGTGGSGYLASLNCESFTLHQECLNSIIPRVIKYIQTNHNPKDPQKPFDKLISQLKNLINE